MIVLDTTVLVYAHGRSHPLRDPCRAILETTASGRIRDVRTTVEVVQEFTQHRSRTRDRAEAAGLARRLAEGLSPLLTATAQDLEDGLRLFEASPLGAFDCVLAACARNNGARALVSADRAFATVPGLTFVDPAEGGAVERLANI